MNEQFWMAMPAFFSKGKEWEANGLQDKRESGKRRGSWVPRDR